MWAVQVHRDLKKYYGCPVNLVFEGNDGNDVIVDAERGWQSLVKLVQVERYTVYLPPHLKHLLLMTGRLVE